MVLATLPSISLATFTLILLPIFTSYIITIMKPDIYLDIDGVLLANDLNPANFVHDFLVKVREVANNVYWLTTHCNGDASTAVKRLSLVLEPRTMELLKDIKPTTWETAKTRAINMQEPFLWFDDDLFFEERQALEANKVLDNWIEVDLAKNPDQLLNFVKSFPMPINAIK
jgi:hypothetical protein